MKMKVAILLSVLLMAPIFAYLPASVHADEEIEILQMVQEQIDELELPDTEVNIDGMAKGTGTHFEVTDSQYADVVIDSSQTIDLIALSVPEIVIMFIGSAPDSEGFTASSTSMTLSGLEPETTYHQYMDNLKNHETFTTDENGSYVSQLDISENHIVIIQPKPSTFFITDDATGGDCAGGIGPIGIWNDATNTCTLTMDLTMTVEIDFNGVTLDGNGHTIDTSGGTGVSLPGVMNVTVENLVLVNNGVGIFAFNAAGDNDSITIRNNTIQNDGGILFIADGDNSSNDILNNTLNNGDGILLISDNGGNFNNSVQNNSINNGDGILFIADGDNSDNDILNNTLNNTDGILLIADGGNFNSIIQNNTLNNVAGDGILLIAGGDNSGNDILNNRIMSEDDDGILLIAGGGNFNNTIEGNSLRNSIQDSLGIALLADGDNSSNDILNNVVCNYDIGILFVGGGGSNNTVQGNTVAFNDDGIFLASDGIKVFNNNFVLNNVQAVDTGAGNTFNEAAPVGGNFWDNFNEPSEGCFNTDPPDRFCDDPFVFSVNQDNLPFTVPIGEDCFLAGSNIEDPVSMNTVRSNSITKTIHVEKQVFNCFLEQGDIPVIVDLTIIGEIFENMNTKSIIKKDALAITCIKEQTSAKVLDCESTPVGADTVPVGSMCMEEPISHPQEMNTVNKGSIVKTIEAQKEVFLCKLPDGLFKKVDLVLFTEIWEDLSKLPDNPVVKKTFLSFRCVVNLFEAEVESCRFTNILD